MIPFIFDRPIHLKPNQKYTCWIKIDSGSSYFGTSHEDTKTIPELGGIEVKFTFCKESYNGTKAKGQIPTLYFL